MSMLTNNLGYPRMGANRELKKACEQYWAGKISREKLFNTAKALRELHWKQQEQAGIDLIPCNDFSFYDHVLDMSLLLGVIPNRYEPVLKEKKGNGEIDLYFAMARGYQQDGLDITAMEMTKWFDSNYHYIVPEFSAGQQFGIRSAKIFEEFTEARAVLNKTPKPVLIGPVSYLLLGKEKEPGFERMDLIQKIIPVYLEILNKLKNECKAEWVQLDEPFLVTDLNERQKQAFIYAYTEIKKHCPGIKTMLTTYFEGLGENISLALSLPVCALHVDLIRVPGQLGSILSGIPEKLSLSLGVIDGRNIWKNDYDHSLSIIREAIEKIGTDRVMIGPGCSLLHVPFDLSAETGLNEEIKNWMAFARQKLKEMNELDQIIRGNDDLLTKNQQALGSRKTSRLIHNRQIKDRVNGITDQDTQRSGKFETRRIAQRAIFHLPPYPTTTIGSFPQTEEIRLLRARFKKGILKEKEYDIGIEKATSEVIRFQEEIGLDVLVHGEFERNDMVEYFGEQLNGFLFTENGWVQSYGSRCVKPPVIYGDISRPKDMTVRWSRFAQAQTHKPMKGMLTGPVTIMQWSFVRDDQPRSETCNQLALAIRDEAISLETAGIRIIQIDEPAIREGLPLHRKDWPAYLEWAIRAFRISASGVKDETQIHTHMCYSEFNDIIEHIAAMDADVITIETSRSQMELLEAFASFKYPNEIGPGVYDIHSPRVPTVAEMVSLLEKAGTYLPPENIWVNPDCGLKTRKWPETKLALINMIKATEILRGKINQPEPA